MKYILRCRHITLKRHHHSEQKKNWAAAISNEHLWRKYHKKY